MPIVNEEFMHEDIVSETEPFDVMLRILMPQFHLFDNVLVFLKVSEIALPF